MIWPALYRKVGASDAEELVRGVENMQIEYGEDLDANWTADVYRTADAVANWGKCRQRTYSFTDAVDRR